MSGFDVVHRAGVKHQATDALSRFRIDGEELTKQDVDVLVCNVGNTPCVSHSIDAIISDDRNTTMRKTGR